MWAGHARADGHEVLIDLPMQLADYPASDPGPHGLLASLAPSDNKERLHWVLGRFSGFVGLMQQVGAAIPASVFEHDVLRVRLLGYRAADLDALCTAGEVVWIGSGSIGPV